MRHDRARPQAVPRELRARVADREADRPRRDEQRLGLVDGERPRARVVVRARSSASTIAAASSPPFDDDRVAEHAQRGEDEVHRRRDAPPLHRREQVRADVAGDVEVGRAARRGTRRRRRRLRRRPWPSTVAGRRRVSPATRRGASRSSCVSGSGSTRASATAVMKLVSPTQRGSTCTWTWPGTPAPAARPMLAPTLMPSGVYAASTATLASCTSAITAAASSRESPARVDS